MSQTDPPARSLRKRGPILTGILAAALLAASGCGGPAHQQEAVPAPGSGGEEQEVRIHLPMRSSGPNNLDPVKGSTVYDNRIISHLYETLLQYKYLVRPLDLEPLLLAEMPEVSEDGTVWRFRLKEGIRFHDDPCFPDGKGRTVTSEDVFYSWKRMADNSQLPESWWLFKDTIKGFDEYRRVQNQAVDEGGTFDYDAPVDGFRILDDLRFEVELKQAVTRFRYILAMFQTSVVPREAVETYGTRLARHPVGTGPFLMREEDFETSKRITLRRNPNYRVERYPSQHEPEDVEHGFHRPSGERIPFADVVEVTMFQQEQPMWLQFRSKELGYTQVPAEFFPEAFIKRTRKLRPEYAAEGITAHSIPLLDFIFIGFNMEDELLGGYTEKDKALRQAISLALDWDERNETFYNGHNVIYDGPIPPGLDGYPEDGRAPVSYRGPNLDRARELLAAAGYPDGRGLPEIAYYASRSGNIPEQAEMTVRQLARIGVRLQPRLLDFSQLIDAINTKKAPLFSFAWSSDYPDGENNLALFYGPNESPGSNHYNYKNPEYDRLYEKILTMRPGPERTAIYERMRDMVIEDAPYAGSMARTRYYLVNPWLKNFKPTEDFDNWYKYLDLEASER